MNTTQSGIGLEALGAETTGNHTGETALFFIGGCGGTAPATANKISNPASTQDGRQNNHSFRMEFGTHTTALGIVLADGTGILVDNGSGVSRVAEFFRDKKVASANVLQTHFHDDHRTGVQNNALLFRKGFVRAIHAPKLPGKSFRELLAEDFSPETWPISPAMLGVELRVEEFTPGDRLNVSHGIETLLLKHPGQAAAFRIRLPHGDVVIATDDELIDPDHCLDYAKFVSGAAILYVDMQYRDPEYQGQAGICGGPAMSRVGWGHSSPEMILEALSLCEKAPSTILIGHHDPSRSDADLREFEREVQRDFKDTLPDSIVYFAREGDTVRV